MSKWVEQVGTSVEHTSGSDAVELRIRKRRSIQEKLQIVQETLHTRVSVAVIARRHGVNANQVFAWRRQYHRGELVEEPAVSVREAVVVPVKVTEVPQLSTSTRSCESGSHGSTAPRLEIELAEGPRLKIWDISSETLRALIRDLVRPC